MSEKLKVLIVDDSEDDAELIARHLRRGGVDAIYRTISTPQDMTDALNSEDWQIVICDHSMPSFSAMQAIQILKEMSLDIPLIVVSGVMGSEFAVQAMRAGARDYLVKDSLSRLVPVIERELREAAQRKASKQLEEQLLQSQKMESLGRLAGGIAHDFNNLLVAIKGYSELGMKDVTPDNPLYFYFEQINAAAASSANLTNQLLAFSRRQMVKTQPINLNQVIKGMKGLVSRIISEELELVADLSADVGKVKADPSQIEQVIINLVVNAADAMEGKRGKIVIKTSNVTVEEDTFPVKDRLALEKGDYVVLSVSDTGTGMSREVLPHIFEPFFTTKAKGKGTGLGLSTCYGIVRQAKGHISVSIEPGVGTTFNIYLPQVAERVEEPVRPEISVNVATGQETVLVVEDQEMVRRLAARVLKDQGYKVLEACNGKEALSIAESMNGKSIDLLLTDVIMPGLNGKELSDRLSKMMPDIRVIYMSGYTGEEVFQNGSNGNGYELLQKPFSTMTLVQKVRATLDAIR